MVVRLHDLLGDVGGPYVDREESLRSFSFVAFGTRPGVDDKAIDGGAELVDEAFVHMQCEIGVGGGGVMMELMQYDTDRAYQGFHALRPERPGAGAGRHRTFSTCVPT